MSIASIKTNLSGVIAQYLSPGAVDLLRQAAEIADKAHQELYLVGGAVRDILLKLPVTDIDLSLNGDAAEIAGQMAQTSGGQLKTHPLFNTATLRTRGLNIDFAMLRAETYARPGALPTVRPGSLQEDLFRRDFTVNAMAVCLNRRNYGEFYDYYGGRRDLENRSIRVLHEDSFTDDPTRMWRAVRYEQRLGFDIEPQTKGLIKKSTGNLPAAGGFRLRHELEMVLREPEPEKILHRAAVLGVLEHTHKTLKADRWLERMFRKLREVSKPHPVPPDAYLALLACRLPPEELQSVTRCLRFSREQTRMALYCRELQLDASKPSIAYVELRRLLAAA